MSRFQVGDIVRGRASAARETIQGKQGSIKSYVGQSSVGSATPMAFEPTYDVQFDGMDELEQLVEESWLEPA